MSHFLNLFSPICYLFHTLLAILLLDNAQIYIYNTLKHNSYRDASSRDGKGNHS